MIDTLFYFVDTELEYRRQMQGENGQPGISPTTIVFVGDSREIYVNGKGYGKTSTNGLLASSEFDQWKGQLNERIDNVITNAASDNEEARQKAEEDLEAAMTLVQSMMDTSAEEMATTIQSVRNQIQEAKTELQENIDSANENADEILSALTTFLGTIRNELETSIRDAITNANGRTIWSELNTTNEGITAMTNRIDQSLNSDGSIKSTEALLSIIDSGVRNNTAITDIQNKWAVMDDNQDVIEWVASGFKSLANNEGGLAAVFASAQNDTQNAISAMKTEIEQDVAGNYVASADLGTSVIGIVEDELQVDSLSSLAMKSDVNAATTTITNRLNTLDTTTGDLQTSLSQVSSVAEEGKARASLLTSVGENGTYLVNESSLDGAMSIILTKSESGSATLIHQMAQDDIAAADISSLIDEATSTLATKVEVNQVVNNLTGEIENRRTAIAGLQAQITGEDGLTNTIAGVDARVTDNEAQLTSIALWQQGTDTWKAGVVQSADLDGAVAGLIADGTKESGKKTRAAVVATVNDDTSAIKINADHVFVDANKTTTIGSHYDNAYNPAKNGVNTSIATLKTNTDKDRATLTAISTWKDNKGYVADAGLVTDANKDGAMAALFAENSNSTTKAAVAAIVDNGLSTVTLTADRVFIEGLLNVNIKSYYDGEIEDINRDIDTLEGTVEGHTTSIADINTKAEKNKSSIEAITTWKDGFVTSYASGLQTEAGLDGAVAELFAENATSGSKSKVTAMVDGKLSTLTLSADKVLIEGQETTIKNYFDSGLQSATNTLQGNINSLGDAIDDVESDVSALSNTVAGHTTSINSIDSKADANAASISLLSTWANEFEGSYTAGLVTEAGLGSAVALLIANNDSGVQAKITTAVKNNSSEIELNADQIKLSGSTLANRIEATEGTIGGVTIANNDIHSANNKFKVTSDGKLTATDATITGAITATSLSLGTNKISTDNITGLSAVATSGSYSSLTGKPNLSAVATSGSYADLSNKPTIPTVPDNIITADQVSISEETTSNGITTKTITVGDNTYTSIVSGDFVKTNIGLGTTSGKYVKIDSDGLLTAKNAVVYGTIYATGGQIGGIGIKNNSIESDNGNFSISSAGKLVAKDAEITGKITATQLTLSGISVPASSVSGLSAVATSGSYSSLSGKPTLSSVATSGNYSDLAGKPSLSAVATSGSYADLSNKPTIPTNITQLTGGANVLHSSDISTSETTRTDGTKVKTITVGDKTYTTISDNNGFIYTNVGLGTKNNTYTKISSNGLLEADNAIIHGTVYATAGSFTGDVVANTLTAGDTNSMYIQTSANAINFMSKGSDGNMRPVAKFESDGNGLFFSVMDEHGDAYSMDWSTWKVTKGDYEDLDVNMLKVDTYCRTFYEGEPAPASGTYGSQKMHLCTKGGTVYTEYKYDAVDTATRGATPSNGSTTALKESNYAPSTHLYGKRIGTLKDVYPNAANGSVVYVINPFYKVTLDSSKDSSALYNGVSGSSADGKKTWYPNVVVEIPLDLINVYRLAHVENATLSWLDKYMYTTSYITPHITNWDDTNVGLRYDRTTDATSGNRIENLSLSGSMTFDSYGLQRLSEGGSYGLSREVNGLKYKPCEMVLCKYSSNFSAHIIEKQINDVSGNTDRRHIRSHITYNSPVTIPASSLMYFAVGVEASSTYGKQWTSDNTSSMKYDQVNLTPVAAGTYW